MSLLEAIASLAEGSKPISRFTVNGWLLLMAAEVNEGSVLKGSSSF